MENAYVVTHYKSAKSDYGFNGVVSYEKAFATRDEAEAYVAERIRNVYEQYKEHGLEGILRTTSDHGLYQVKSFGNDLFMWAVEQVSIPQLEPAL